MSNRSGRSGSGVRSRLFMGKHLYLISLDAQEKAEQDDWAKEEYEREIDELKHQEGVTTADIDQFKKSAIIKKSIENVKMRAQQLAAVRHSPTRYQNVKSKVSRCIKVQKKTAKKNKKAKA